MTDSPSSAGGTACTGRLLKSLSDGDDLLVPGGVPRSAIAPGFATRRQSAQRAAHVSMLGIIAFGMTAVIIAGEIDLSVGAGRRSPAASSPGSPGSYSDSLGARPRYLRSAYDGGDPVGFVTGSSTGKARQCFNVPTFITTLATIHRPSWRCQPHHRRLSARHLPVLVRVSSAAVTCSASRFPSTSSLLTFVGMHFLMNYTRFGRADLCGWRQHGGGPLVGYRCLVASSP